MWSVMKTSNFWKAANLFLLLSTSSIDFTFADIVKLDTQDLHQKLDNENVVFSKCDAIISQYLRHQYYKSERTLSHKDTFLKKTKDIDDLDAVIDNLIDIRLAVSIYFFCCLVLLDVNY